MKTGTEHRDTELHSKKGHNECSLENFRLGVGDSCFKFRFLT